MEAGDAEACLQRWELARQALMRAFEWGLDQAVASSTLIGGLLALKNGVVCDIQSSQWSGGWKPARVCLQNFSGSSEEQLLNCTFCAIAASNKFIKEMKSIFQVKFGSQARDDLQVTSREDIRMDIVFMNDDGNKHVLYMLFPAMSGEQETDGATTASKRGSATKSEAMGSSSVSWDEMEWIRSFNRLRMAQQVAMALREFAIQFIVPSAAASVTETQKVARQQHAGWNAIIEGEAKQVIEFGSQIYVDDRGDSELLMRRSHPIKISADASSIISGLKMLDICTCTLMSEALVSLRNSTRCKVACSKWARCSSWQDSTLRLTGFHVKSNNAFKTVGCTFTVNGPKGFEADMTNLCQVKYGEQARDDIGSCMEDETARRVDLVFYDVTKKGKTITPTKVVIHLLFPVLGASDCGDAEDGFEFGGRQAIGIAVGLREFTRQYCSEILDAPTQSAVIRARRKHASWIEAINHEQQKYLAHGPTIDSHRTGGATYQTHQTIWGTSSQTISATVVERDMNINKIFLR